MGIVQGKRALVVGVANDKSLAWSIAQTLAAEGAEVAMTYQGEILEKRVRPLAAQIEADVIGELDVNDDTQIASVFAALKKKWDGLDLLVHAVAFAEREDLRDRFLTVSRENFKKSLEISAYSLVALARAAEPLMEARGGGSILTLSYLGAVRAIPNYNMMGVAKAALEACVRYLSVDLGVKNIRVNALSAGPARTLSSSAIRDFHSMQHEVEARIVEQLVWHEVDAEIPRGIAPRAALDADDVEPLLGQLVGDDCPRPAQSDDDDIGSGELVGHGPTSRCSSRRAPSG